MLSSTMSDKLTRGKKQREPQNLDNRKKSTDFGTGLSIGHLHYMVDNTLKKWKADLNFSCQAEQAHLTPHDMRQEQEPSIDFSF